jgi:hypothetical protein
VRSDSSDETAIQSSILMTEHESVFIKRSYQVPTGLGRFGDIKRECYGNLRVSSPRLDDKSDKHTFSVPAEPENSSLWP